MILFINTAENESIEVGLIKNGQFYRQKVKSRFQESEKLLGLIDKLLKNKKKTPGDIKKILIVRGPGGFTALRIGAAVANTLAFSLKIPIIGVTKAEFVKNDIKSLLKKKSVKIITPLYGREANITRPKKQWLK
jgi:tRNA threonylcarbamoyladenosine biosynthesis protein TsaB